MFILLLIRIKIRFFATIITLSLFIDATTLFKNTNNMKKILLLMMVIIPVVGVSANNLFPFKEINKKWNIGIIGGYVGYGRDMSNGAVGLSLTIKGFYADFMGWPSSHENDMGVDKWPDKKCNTVHLGYQIPIVKRLRITPVIGYAKVSYGTTDGSDYEFSNSGTVHNKYYEKENISGFDFGGIATINIKKVNINLAVTRFALFGGISLEF